MGLQTLMTAMIDKLDSHKLKDIFKEVASKTPNQLGKSQAKDKDKKNNHSKSNTQQDSFWLKIGQLDSDLNKVSKR